MTTTFSREEKDAVVDFAFEEINYWFSNINEPCWYFIDTDDSYMKDKLKKKILNMDTTNLLYSNEIVDFDGAKNLNDDFKFLKIRDAVMDGDKLLLFTNILDYEKWYIENHPEENMKHPLISRINFLRDSLFNDYNARMIFLFSQEENKAFQLYGLDFYTQNFSDKDLDFLIKRRKEEYIFTESEKKELSKQKKLR